MFSSHLMSWGVTQTDGGQSPQPSPSHQMVNFPPVDRLISATNQSNEGGMSPANVLELDGVMNRGAAVGKQEEEQRGKIAA